MLNMNDAEYNNIFLENVYDKIKNINNKKKIIL